MKFDKKEPETSRYTLNPPYGDVLNEHLNELKKHVIEFSN